MVKTFKIVAAGLTSGVLVLLTSYLGLTGTVIGSVISSVLYNAIQGYIDEKSIAKKEYGVNLDLSKDRLDLELFYMLPLVVILFILLSYLFTRLLPDFVGIFSHLEGVTNDNLFKIMGIGLIVMGIYPAFQKRTIRKVNGLLIVFSGIALILWGFLDDFVFEFGGFADVFFDSCFILVVIICLILIYVLSTIVFYRFKLSKNKTNNLNRTDFKSDNIKPHNINHSKSYKGVKNTPNNINKKVSSRLENRNKIPEDPKNNNPNSNQKSHENTINTSTDSLKFYSNKKR